ncbi:hypothetical protein [Erythrobacter oryzae]|uniref:hypothetical protein n=1 Tax=Erythrobacter oryzae TaxID=3019556 RepID=UPI00255415D8|nr:hypothetical protein [Erythrobacter sp. COR-2]
MRQERLTPGGFERVPPKRRGRRWPWVAGLAALALTLLAWFDGGEEALRPIAEDVSLPEQGQ